MTSFGLCITSPFLLSSKNISNRPPNPSSYVFCLVTLPLWDSVGSVALSSWGRSWCSRGMGWRREVVSLPPAHLTFSMSWFFGCFLSWLSSVNVRAGSEEMTAFKKAPSECWLASSWGSEENPEMPQPRPAPTLGGGVFCLARGLHFGIPSISWPTPGRAPLWPLCWEA